MRIIAICLCLLFVANLSVLLIPSQYLRINFPTAAHKPKRLARGVKVPLEVVHTLAAPAFRHRGPVYCMAATNDGKQLLTGSREGIVLWELATGRRLMTLDNGTATRLEVARDRFAYASNSTAPRVKDLATGRLRAVMEERSTNPAIALAPDGTKLASPVGNDIRLWDTDTGKPVGTLTGHTGWVKDIVFGPDGKTLYSVSLG